VKKKLIPLALLLIISLLVVGCGPAVSEDVAELQAEIAERNAEITKLKGEITQLKAGEPIEPIAWRVSYWGGPGSTPESFQYWADEMEARTDGRFTAEIHFGGVLAPGPEGIDGVRAGLFEMAHVFTNWHPGKTPLSEGFTLPFIGPSGQKQLFMWEQMINAHPYMVDEFGEWNARIDILPIAAGIFEIMSEAPISSTDDFDGLRMEVGGLQGEAFIAFGAVPTDFEIPEMYEAHDKGLIDANCGGWPGLFGMLSLYELLPYATVGVSPGTVHPVWMVNVDAWDALPDEVKGVQWDEVKPQMIDKTIEITNVVNDGYFAKMDAQGVQISDFPASEREKLIGVSAATWDRWASEKDADGLPGTEFVQLLRTASAWAQAGWSD